MKVKIVHGFTDPITNKNYQDNEIAELSDDMAEKLKGSFVEPFNEPVIEKDSKEYEEEISKLKDVINDKDEEISKLKDVSNKLKTKESENKKNKKNELKESSKNDEEVNNNGEVQE